MTNPDWRAIALYLADCQAATTLHDRFPNDRRERMKKICLDAAEAITNDGPVKGSVQEYVVKRLRIAAGLQP